MKRGEPRDLDRAIGARIRERRVQLGMTQDEVAKLTGVTYQQQHKYERGINRVSAARLLSIARVLNVPISFFYEGLGAEVDASTPRERMTLELARNFAAIANPVHQEALSQMARALAGAA
jgi:transcriptional regulator with XRE-family HTH domain